MFYTVCLSTRGLVPPVQVLSGRGNGIPQPSDPTNYGLPLAFTFLLGYVKEKDHINFQTEKFPFIYINYVTKIFIAQFRWIILATSGRFGNSTH